jgi:hypothetical protein
MSDIRELIKEYRDDIWLEAYCHPFSRSTKSDSMLEKIESELKELEEKAEAFDWLSEQKWFERENFGSVDSWLTMQGDTQSGGDKIIMGKDLLECVRKARGEE